MTDEFVIKEKFVSNYLLKRKFRIEITLYKAFSFLSFSYLHQFSLVQDNQILTTETQGGT